MGKRIRFRYRVLFKEVVFFFCKVKEEEVGGKGSRFRFFILGFWNSA